jgi:surfeit locus 1 family protein
MPSLATSGQQPPPPPLVGLSTSGKLFFGSLCVGTFGLGVWQLQRLLEKQKLVEERTSQLQMEPTRDLSSWKSGNDSESTDNNSNRSNYRRRLVQGVFRYDYEVLVGPRGAPPGVQPERKGMSAKQKGSGASSGGAPGPQGYHVLTPLEVRVPFSSDGPTKNPTVVWVNRGWIPKTRLPQKEGNRGRRGETPAPKPVQEPDTPITWNRPTGPVEIIAVQTSVESKFRVFIAPVWLVCLC